MIQVLLVNSNLQSVLFARGKFVPFGGCFVIHMQFPLDSEDEESEESIGSDSEPEETEEGENRFAYPEFSEK